MSEDDAGDGIIFVLGDVAKFDLFFLVCEGGRMFFDGVL